MSTLEQQLQHIRPRIETISPIAGYSILGFGIFNVLLGSALFFYRARFADGISILNYIFNYQFWGVAFFLTGTVLLHTYRVNQWQRMRQLLVVLLFGKSIWLIALLGRFFFYNYDNVLLLLMWSALTFWQILVYIFFLPVPPREEDV